MKRPGAAAAVLLLAASMAGPASPAGDQGKGDSPWTAPEEAQNRSNPIPPAPGSVESGRIVYEKYCLSCHGRDGKGKGPVATRLGFSAGDLTDGGRMSAQTDGAIYWKIATGRDPMPAFKETGSLTDEQIWNVINYTRTFAPPADDKTPPDE